MEFIVGLALIGGLVYVAINVFCYYVAPVLEIVGLVVGGTIAGIALLVGLCHAIANYIYAIRKNVNFRDWEWDNDGEPARLSYFFGPGYKQLVMTIQHAFALNALSKDEVANTAKKIQGEKGGWIRVITGLIYQICASVSIYVIGFILCGIFGIIHGSITAIIMAIIYIVFVIIWIVDRLYLIVNKIRSDCPVCHTRFLIPAFVCPDCGAVHKKLVPGPYGIWKHRCVCGKKIPSTFLNGRSKLEAYCPICNSSLVASDARPIVFQLVGGSKAGKTVYLAAFFHEYLVKLSQNRNLKVTISNQYKPYFDELEEWFSGGDCPATAQLNSQMYPIMIESSLGVKRQFSIYDIAGEMFDGTTADVEINQQQFHYCNGLIFMIDPFSGGNLRSNRIGASEDVSEFSDMATEDVVNNFINYFIRTGRAKANVRSSIPVSVIVTKSDIKEVKREIGPAKINSIFEKDMQKYGTLENARDKICRQFLIDIGLSAAVDALEVQFTTVHYFPISAMGHSPDGSQYEPWGVTESIEWMVPIADKGLAEIIDPQKNFQ